MVGDQIVRVAELQGEALQAFFDLVSGSASESLGDGEAATLAFAHGMGCSECATLHHPPMAFRVSSNDH
jgi:hypothetical protein